MKRVIVTDTQYRMALAPMRELAEKKYRVTAAEFSTVAPKARLGFFSRDAADTLTLGTDDEGFCAAVERAAGGDRPTLLCVKGGKTVKRLVGFREKDALKKELEAL